MYVFAYVYMDVRVIIIDFTSLRPGKKKISLPFPTSTLEFLFAFSILLTCSSYGL